MIERRRVLDEYLSKADWAQQDYLNLPKVAEEMNH